MGIVEKSRIKFENPWCMQVLPEGYACAATDRCFLLANCCTLRRREARLHLIYQRKKDEEKKGRKIHLSCPRLAPLEIRSTVREGQRKQRRNEDRARLFVETPPRIPEDTPLGVDRSYLELRDSPYVVRLDQPHR